MTRHRFVLPFILGVLMLALAPATALAQGGPPAPEPVDQPEGIAELRERFEDLSYEEVQAAGYQIAGDCVSAPGLGGMGYHATSFKLYEQQFNAGTMDPEHPPILLLDEDRQVVGLEWEALNLGQGTLELFGQTVQVQPGHPGAEEPHFMMHVYFRQDGQVLMLSSDDVPPFDPQVECPAGMPEAGAGGMAGTSSFPRLPVAALAVVLVAGSGWALTRRIA